jgi:hypothetical protein
VALEPLAPDELAAELERRDCARKGERPNGYSLWESCTGEPFSVAPPEELIAGETRYPGWFLDDLIREVGLPAHGKKPN